MSVLVSRCAIRSVELIRKFNRSIEIRNCVGNTIINTNRGASTLCQRYTIKPPGRNDNTAVTTNCMSIRFKSSKKGDKQKKNAHEDSDEVCECLINSVCLFTKFFFVFHFVPAGFGFRFRNVKIQWDRRQRQKSGPNESAINATWCDNKIITGYFTKVSLPYINRTKFHAFICHHLVLAVKSRKSSTRAKSESMARRQRRRAYR